MNDIKLKFTDVLEQHYHESYDDEKFFQKVDHFIDKEFTNFLVQYQINLQETPESYSRQNII